MPISHIGGGSSHAHTPKPHGGSIPRPVGIIPTCSCNKKKKVVKKKK